MSHHPRMVADPPTGKNRAAAAEPTVRQPHQKLGVLVVDDEQLVRIMVQKGLERNGFAVWLARNGPDAIDLYRVRKEDIAVVLLDVRMPGLDGPQTLDALRELNHEVSACFMSGDTGGYDPKDLLRRGAAYVFAKPFRLDDLANILRLIAHGVPNALLPS